MQKSYLKTIIVALLASCIAFVSSAQLRVPENVPIGFYGKVVDQDGRPVVGASVSFDFTVSYMMENRAETTPMTLQTDQNGAFALTGVTGYCIDKLSIQREGYELSEKTTRGYVFGLRDYKPNADNPVILKMWKQAGKESLISSSWRGKIACDGTTNRFDILTGKPSAGGVLEIACTRTPLVLTRTNLNHFDYRDQIVIIGGGIQPTSDEFSYLAPESGYSSMLAIGTKASDPGWPDRTKQEFYIKTADGHYGRLWVSWNASQDSPTRFEWNCSINPSGSRNLER
jgi:hypothetical protein